MRNSWILQKFFSLLLKKAGCVPFKYVLSDRIQIRNINPNDTSLLWRQKFLEVKPNKSFFLVKTVTYPTVVAKMVGCNILGFSSKSPKNIGLFSVSKDGTRKRLVLDAER